MSDTISRELPDVRCSGYSTLVPQFNLTVCVQHMLSAFVTHHLASLLRWSGLPQGEDVATDWDFSPQAGFRVLAEAVAWVHHQNTVGGQTIHLTVLHPPLGRLLLWRHEALMFPLSPEMKNYSSVITQDRSLPRGRCSWRSQTLQHRSVLNKEGFFGRWCGRRSGRWCSELSDCLHWPDHQAPYLSPQSQWDSL